MKHGGALVRECHPFVSTRSRYVTVLRPRPSHDDDVDGSPAAELLCTDTQKNARESLGEIGRVQRASKRVIKT
jgi:hypothetical protein